MSKKTGATEEVVESSEDSQEQSDSSKPVTAASLFRKGLGDTFAKMFLEEDGGEAGEGKAASSGASEEETEDDREPTEEKTGDATEEDEELAELQRKLALTDAEKAKLGQEAAYLKRKIEALDPLLQLGLAVQKDPALFKAVQARLSGQKMDGQRVEEMTPMEFLQALRASVREEVVGVLDAHTSATREWNDIEARARRELTNFDVVSKHPDFMAWVSVFDDAIAKGVQRVPESENPVFFALRKAYDTMIASNPDYVKAVAKSAADKAKKSVAKKIEAVGPGAPSKGSATNGETKLTADEKDRLGMVASYLRGAGGRRLPSARR